MGMCCYLTPARGVTTYGLTPLRTCLIPRMELSPGHYFCEQGPDAPLRNQVKIVRGWTKPEELFRLNSEPRFSYVVRHGRCR